MGATPTDAPAVTESSDEFKYLLVDAARDGYDLYDALDQSFEESTVDWEGGTAKRRYAARTIPPILQIQLQVRSVARTQSYKCLTLCTASTIRCDKQADLQVERLP